MRSGEVEKVVSLEEIPTEPEVDEEEGDGSHDVSLRIRIKAQQGFN
jgi:hypothetical protein